MGGLEVAICNKIMVSFCFMVFSLILGFGFAFWGLGLTWGWFGGYEYEHEMVLRMEWDVALQRRIKLSIE